ncbi:MAG: type II toxin-antitoxin system VapC family toxin [Gemmatimonadaceae bacterium]
MLIVASADKRRISASRKKTGDFDQACYIESSGLLAAILEKDAAAIRSVRTAAQPVTSALTLTEANRAIVRGRATGRLTADREREAIHTLQTFEQRCTILVLSGDVLIRAGRPFPAEPIRTLDAIHLATLEQLGGAPQLVTILTRDARVRENALALGYNVE